MKDLTQKPQSNIGAVMHLVAVTEKIPENRQRVLCYNGHRMIQSSWCMHTDQDEEWFKRTYTHWCTLPVPPCA